MTFKNFTKVPLILLVGILLGIIISTVLISSKTSNETKQTVSTEELDILPYNVFQPTVPSEVWFADEKVPIEYFDVYESLDYELVVNTYRHSSTIMYLKRAERYFPIIEPILKEKGIPDDFKYLCVAESGISHAISPAGATGFWQFMKATGREYDLEINRYVDERYNVIKTTYAACDYLNTAYRKFGKWSLAAVSYNMGMAGLQRRINQQKADNYWDLYLNTEPSRYVYRILALKIVMSDPITYGFNIPKESLHQPISYTTISVDTTINQLQEFAFKHGLNYKLLKIFNPWIRDTMLMNNSGKEYSLIIPDSTARVRKTY